MNCTCARPLQLHNWRVFASAKVALRDAPSLSTRPVRPIASTPREQPGRIAHDGLRDRRLAHAELDPIENVVPQQMEQDDMASETHPDQRQTPEQESRKEWHSPAQPPQGGPPMLIHGLELPRSSDC
jgi:hypothetical protein